MFHICCFSVIWFSIALATRQGYLLRSLLLRLVEAISTAQRYGSTAAAGLGRLACIIAPFQKTRRMLSAAQPLSAGAGVGRLLDFHIDYLFHSF